MFVYLWQQKKTYIIYNVAQEAWQLQDMTDDDDQLIFFLVKSIDSPSFKPYPF